MKSPRTELNRQFDHILDRIESGEIDQGINHLAGMLDAVLLDWRHARTIRLALQGHPLGHVLRQPALARSTRQLGITAALQAREQLSQSTLAVARKRGEDYLVPATARSIVKRSTRPASRFDLILAANLPDQLDASQLGTAIAQGAQLLAAGGRLVISAFISGHLGCGWHAIWLGKKIHRHDPQTIAEDARSAGLEPRLFHDASGCLVWAELRCAQSGSARGKRHV